MTRIKWHSDGGMKISALMQDSGWRALPKDLNVYMLSRGMWSRYYKMLLAQAMREYTDKSKNKRIRTNRASISMEQENITSKVAVISLISLINHIGFICFILSMLKRIHVHFGKIRGSNSGQSSASRGPPCFSSSIISVIFCIVLVALLSGCGGGGGGGGVAPTPTPTATVAASVDKTAASTNELVTLTCATTGTIASLEARCNSSDAFSAVSSGNTKSCVYTGAGSYTPGCRINGSTTDNVDSAVVVTVPATTRTLSGRLTTTILIPAGADTKYPAGLAQDAGLSGWEVLVFDNSQITANPATDGISNLFTLTPVGTATTDASGNWSVTGLPSGIYAIWLRDENSFYQMAQDILVRNPDNTYNTSQQDSLTKLGWTDILFRSIDASNGNVTDLNEQPIPNLGEVYGLNITYHASFVELFEFMSDTRPSCGLIGDGQGNSTCVVGRTYGLTIVTLVRPTARSPPYYLNCGSYNNGSVDYDDQCATAITEWNTAIRSWRAVDGFRANTLAGDNEFDIISTDYTDSTRSTVNFTNDTENFKKNFVLVIKNNETDANYVKGLFEHEGFRVFGSFTNSYLGSSISYSGSGTIQPVEGAFAAYILGRTQSVNNGLIKLWPGYSTEAAANDITRILIQ